MLLAFAKSARFDFDAKLLKSNLRKIGNGSKRKRSGAQVAVKKCATLYPTNDATDQMTQI